METLSITITNSLLLTRSPSLLSSKRENLAWYNSLTGLRNVSLKDKIQEDLKTSLKARDQVRSLTLRMLLAAMVNKEKEGK